MLSSTELQNELEKAKKYLIKDMKVARERREAKGCILIK